MDAHSLGMALGDFLAFVPGQRGLAVYAVFLCAGGFFGICVVLLDACSVGLGGKSALGLTHGWWMTCKNVAIWFCGALIASGLGMVARIFEPTPLAALLAAVSWRTLLNKLLAMAQNFGQDTGNGKGR